MSFAKVIVNGQTGESFQRWVDAPHPGIFTSFRALARDGGLCVLGLPLHYERLVLGCQRFGLLAPSLADITFEIRRGMEDLQLIEARIRVELFRDLHITRIARIEPLARCSPSIALQSLCVSRPYEDLKSSYGATFSERCQSKCQPSCETLYVDPIGCVIEGAWSNFGWIDPDGSICFTGKGLDGVTQRIVGGLFSKGGRDVRIKSATIEYLVARHVSPFIMSALRGVVLVSNVDDVLFHSSEGVLEIQGKYVDATYSSPYPDY
jgi:branched-subunit amino acid aminotransferase/4-amino-4-deoxychorismate lyase